MDDSKKTNLLNFELPEDLEVIYANMVRISHTPGEMVFDFARLLPGQKETEVVARILMSPIAAKFFYNALGSNLARFEATFGKIQVPGDDNTLASNLFRTIHPPESPDSEK